MMSKFPATVKRAQTAQAAHLKKGTTGTPKKKKETGQPGHPKKGPEKDVGTGLGVAQNGTVWKPSPKQAAVLDVARTGQMRSLSAICRTAGVPRRTFYNWLKDDAHFADSWNAIWRGTAQQSMPLIIAAMVRKAVRGDVAAARLVAEIAEATRHTDLAAFANLKFEVNLVGGSDAVRP